MKYLIFFLLSLPTVLFSQNYHYAVDKAKDTPDSVSPTVPNDVTIIGITETTANLSWTASTDNIGVTNYQIYNNGTLLTTVIGTSTSYSFNNLVASTDYSITLKAIDAAGNESNFSIATTFTTNTPPDTTPPSIPTDILISDITETTANLTWIASTDNVGVTNYQIFNDGTLLTTVNSTATSYSFNNLVASTDYSITLKAIDAAGNESDFSVVTTFTTNTPPDTTPPTVPANILVSDITDTTANISWAASTDNVGVTNYQIYNNWTLLSTVNGATTSYSLNNLLPTTEYSITLKAIDANNNQSDFSLVSTFTTNTPPDTTAPSVPTDIQISDITETTANLTWTTSIDNVGVTNYQIFNNGVLLTTINGTTTNYSFNNLIASTDYSITLKAIDAASNESDFSTNATFTTSSIIIPPPVDVTPPSVPLDLIVSGITETNATITWSPSVDNVGVTSYQIFSNGTLFTSLDGAITSYVFNDLTASTDYSVSIKAIDAAGNQSDFSIAATFTTDTPPDITPPSVPTDILISDISETSANLNWTASTDNVGVTNYQIFNNDTLLATVNGATTSYSFSNLIASTNYSTTLKAVDAEGNQSDFSIAAAFTTNTPPDTTPPSTPIDIVISDITETSANLTWTPSTDNIGVTNYQIFNNNELITSVDGSINTYTFENLSPSTDYSINLKATDAANNESNLSSTSQFTTVTPTETYTLTEDAATSAGVFDKDGNLLRTLWTNENKLAGTHEAPIWDGFDDEGNDVKSQGETIKIVANNINAEWEGVIGNSSDSFTGESVFFHYNPFYDMMVINNEAYFCNDYSEQDGSISKISLSDTKKQIYVQPRQKVYQATERICTDGKVLYMGGRVADAKNENLSFVYAAKFDDLGTPKNYLDFQNETINVFHFTYKATDITDSVNLKPRITGMAVQKNGNYLFVARELVNSLHILHKTSGVKLHDLNFIKPKHCKVDKDDNLWIVHDETLEKFTVDALTGTIQSTGFKIDGFTNIQGIAFNPDESIIAISDTRNYHQVFGYSTTTGELQWTLGREENYIESPKVYNDKFALKDNRDEDDVYGFLAFEEDGSLWVNDKGNDRYLKFNSNREYVDQISFRRHIYNINIDPNNPTRVFGNFLEYKVDYSKPLTPKNENNAWELMNNWGVEYIGYDDNNFNVLENVTTLSNGRTYFLAVNKVNLGLFDIVELIEGQGMRDTGVDVINYNNSTELKPNGIFTRVDQDKSTNEEVFFERPIIGFDGLNNPILGDEIEWGRYKPGLLDPVQDGAHEVSGEITNNGNRVIFNGKKGNKYHLGAIKKGKSSLSFRTAKGTFYNRKDPYPYGTNLFDIREEVKFAGNVALAMDDWIVWGYNGEFWESSQTNMWHMVSEEGLFLRDFGTTGDLYNIVVDYAPAKMAGNAFSPAMVKIGNDIYFYHNDEFFHSGIHRWKISNLDSIKKIEIKLAK